MAGSLQDQLLGAGLATKKQANKAKADQRKKTKKSKAVKKGEVYQDQDEQDRQAAIARQKEEKLEKDKALNREREEQRLQKEIDAAARQIIQQNIISIPEDGDVEYNFVDGSKIKKLYVNNELQNQLANGNLAIAQLDSKYVVIPAGAAEKINERRPELIISRQEKETVDPDDPYADFQIPDDLMW